MSATAQTGSAERWGPAWGSRANDWAANEEQQLPTYTTALDEIGLTAGQRVLEVGCGSGVFLRAAADRGASVFGLDASPALLELARARVPEADLRVGDLQFLPYSDDSFNVVAGFNAFFFAADMRERDLRHAREHTERTEREDRATERDTPAARDLSTRVWEERHSDGDTRDPERDDLAVPVDRCVDQERGVRPDEQPVARSDAQWDRQERAEQGEADDTLLTERLEIDRM